MPVYRLRRFRNLLIADEFEVELNHEPDEDEMRRIARECASIENSEYVAKTLRDEEISIVTTKQSQSLSDSFNARLKAGPNSFRPIAEKEKTTIMQNVSVSDEQLAAILAALRTYQQLGYSDPNQRPDDIHDIATDGDTLVSLDDEGIDELCDLLNSPIATR